MRAHFGLPSVENDEKEGKPPITVKFEIPYFTVSGIQVCCLGICICVLAFSATLFTLVSTVTCADILLLLEVMGVSGILIATPLY